MSLADLRPSGQGGAGREASPDSTGEGGPSVTGPPPARRHPGAGGPAAGLARKDLLAVRVSTELPPRPGPGHSLHRGPGRGRGEFKRSH